jgi:hypothetical protein
MSSIPKIPDDERTPLVTALLEIIQILLKQHQALKGDSHTEGPEAQTQA